MTCRKSYALLLVLAVVYIAPTLAAPVAFVDVSVVDMDRGAIAPHQTVVVDEGVIQAVGAAETVTIPPGTRRISGRGRYLMPGLVDMHVHFIRPPVDQFQKSSASTFEEENRQLGILFVANGVTSVRNMWGHPEILKLNARIASGEVLGPTIYSTGPITDGEAVVYAGSRIVTNEVQAQNAVREDKELGYSGIKVYNRLTLDAYLAIAAEARRLQLPLVGHIPRAVSLAAALEARHASIEHLTGFELALVNDNFATGDATLEEILEHFDRRKLPAVASAVKAAGAWNTPTIVQVQMGAESPQWAQARALVPAGLVERYAREPLPLPASYLPFALAVVGALHEAGAKLLIGTDAYKPNVIPGTSLHEELGYFVRAGLTPHQALRAATIDPAIFLGREQEFGAVATNRRADLLLLNSNPLLDVKNASDRAGVMVRGTWLSEDELQARVRERVQ